MQTSPSTFARAEVVTRRLASLDEPVDPAWLQSLLSSRENGELPVCRPHNANDPGATFTAASMVMEFGEEPLLHITAGPPSENPYTTFRFG